MNRKALRGMWKSVSDLFKNDTFGYNSIERIYYAGWAFSVFDAVILFFIIKFLCFSSGIFEKKNSVKKQSSLITLFEKNKNICVKCRTAKNEKTVHCIVCNGCVRDFDHHCSWLNICINKENINWFRAFLYLFLAYILLNILFFVYSKYIYL